MMIVNHNITRWAKVFLCLSALFIFANLGYAQKIPDKPNPPRLVNDFAHILNGNQIQALEKKLVAYSDSTSTQICVVTVTNLGGTDSNDFAYKIGKKWGVGTEKDNGIVILILPKTTHEQGDVSIQVGRAIEPYVTDAAAKLIQTKIMIPEFKKNDYYAGIDKACDAMFGLLTGTFSPDDLDDDDEWLGIFVVFLAIIVVFVLIWASKKNRNNNSSNGTGQSGRKIGFWEGVLLGSLMSGGRRGGWGGSGGGWGGGHSSGGFGGFGGGHFGGGGASSKW